MNVTRYAKAITGGITAGAAAITSALADGILTGQEGGTIAFAILVGAGLVYAVPNSAPARNTDLPE